MQLTDYVELREDGLYWKKQRRGCKVGERVGCLNTEGYRVFGFNGKQYKEHREIFFMVNGYYPELVDHKNRDTSDNKSNNLRDADQHQNQYNRDNVLGYREKRGKYEARISYNGKRIHLGTFNCSTTAHLAYLKAAKELYGEWSAK